MKLPSCEGPDAFAPDHKGGSLDSYSTARFPSQIYPPLDRWNCSNSPIILKTTRKSMGHHHSQILAGFYYDKVFDIYLVASPSRCHKRPHVTFISLQFSKEENLAPISTSHWRRNRCQSIIILGSGMLFHLLFSSKAVRNLPIHELPFQFSTFKGRFDKPKNFHQLWILWNTCQTNGFRKEDNHHGLHTMFLS